MHRGIFLLVVGVELRLFHTAMSDFAGCYGCSADGYHQHGASYGLVIDVYSDDGIGPESLGFLYHLCDGLVLGLADDFLVGSGPASDDVPDAGKEVSEHVGAHDALACDDAVIGGYLPVLKGGCGTEYHDMSILL